MSTRTDRYPAQYALFLIAYYVTNSVYQGFMTLYYDSVGFSSTQIGYIYAAIALTTIAAQPLWGTCGDRMKSRNALLRMLAVAAGAVMLTFTLSTKYIPLLLLACLFSSFYTSIQPMGDSIILENLQKGRFAFGPIRLAGGLSFAVSSTAFGMVLNAPGRESWAIYISAALCGLIVLSTFALPKTPGQQAVGGRRMSMTALLKEKELMKLLAFTAPMMITMGYFYTFFSPHFVSLKGGNSALLGWCYFISAVSEVPYLLLSDKLFDKFGVGKLMCLSAIALIARWLSLAVTDNYIVAMLSQIFHGWGFIVITVGLAKYISLTVPLELKASGQMLLAVVSFGIARVVGNLGGGMLADLIGRQNVFYVSAAVCLLALIAFGPYYMRHKPLNGAET